MRVLGFSEDDEGNGAYLLREGMELLFYREEGKTMELLSPEEGEALFESGVLDRWDLPAEEVFFPDELAHLEALLKGGRS